MIELPLSRPDLGEEESAAAREAILSGWVTQGPRVRKFEGVFAARLGAPAAVAVSSCTAALHLALVAAGVGPGDCVITVSHSFIATANAIRHAGAEPWFVDVASDGNLDVGLLARDLSEEFVPDDRGLRLGPAGRARLTGNPDSCWKGRDPARCGRLGAILAVHQLGMPCDLARYPRFRTRCPGSGG
jgi:perosamine synthetase